MGPKVESEDFEVAGLLFELKKLELEAKENCLYMDWEEVWKIVHEIEDKSTNLKLGEEFIRIKG